VEGEERALVESPREVPTYDHKPEMSAEDAAATFVSHWSEGNFRYSLVISRVRSSSLRTGSRSLKRPSPDSGCDPGRGAASSASAARATSIPNSRSVSSSDKPTTSPKFRRPLPCRLESYVREAASARSPRPFSRAPHKNSDGGPDRPGEPIMIPLHGPVVKRRHGYFTCSSRNFDSS
jgi:hypothetical protein